MAWRLEGNYFENCNCDVLCPCAASFFALPADNERCQAVMVFDCNSGEVDGVDVGGLTWALVADTPGKMADGNWRVGLLVDESASEEQSAALGPVISGERGGAPAAFGPFIGEVMGMETASFDFSSKGNRHSVRIGGVGEIEIEDFVAEGETEPVKLTNVPHPANTTLTVAHATKSSIKAFGLELENTGKNGHAAPFSWSGD